jgi:hypothetical protein
MSGLRVKRIREGSDLDKIAFIGRSMGGRGTLAGVNGAVTHFKSLNMKAEKFRDDAAFDALIDQRNRTK